MSQTKIVSTAKLTTAFVHGTEVKLIWMHLHLFVAVFFCIENKLWFIRSCSYFPKSVIKLHNVTVQSGAGVGRTGRRFEAAVPAVLVTTHWYSPSSPTVN